MVPPVDSQCAAGPRRPAMLWRLSAFHRHTAWVWLGSIPRPKMSTCTCENRSPSISTFWIGVFSWRVTLALQHFMQSLKQARTSLVMCGHTYLLARSLHIDLTPAWASKWVWWKTCSLRTLGTRGQNTAVEVSHHTCTLPTPICWSCSFPSLIIRCTSSSLSWASAICSQVMSLPEVAGTTMHAGWLRASARWFRALARV